ncbi:hypothetical protein [Blastococcus brunescens]|uniref:WD40 repeat domain-containing protein n=1 Tax=Blastococcus brunescens TaxID=1564165 RepID=A0ABZ1AZ84_9ACTN|nr:hypothetical protein [Blastococcus sp. BMG 8361]WRL62958.1 hypothetical protein U6N30_24345 [Blastococcus sp. BMG 8361]
MDPGRDATPARHGRHPDGFNGDVAVVDPRTGEVVDVAGVPVTAQAMQPTPDGEHIVVAGRAGGSIHVLDADTLDWVDSVDLGSRDFVVTLAFSPDGRRLVGGGKFGLLHVIDTGSWEPVALPANVHDDAVLQVEWLDDRTVVSSGVDATVRLFDVERGSSAPSRCGRRPTRVPAPPGSCRSRGGGHRPERGPAGPAVPLDPGRWADQACRIVDRDLTREEWDRYLPEQPYEATCTSS